MPVDHHQLIDDYLLNNLSDKERMDFENELSNNEDLRLEVELRRRIIKAVKGLGRDKMKDRLKGIHREVNNPATIRRRIWPLISGIAASIALLVVGWSYFANSSSTSPQELFAANYEPYQLSLVSRDNTTKEIATLNTLYNNKEYKATLPLFEKALEQSPKDARMLMGSGISLLELGELKKARTRFTSILENRDLRLSDTANWYIAMSFLKEGKTMEAKNALKSLVDNPMADRHKEAVSLVKMLD